LGNLSIYVAQIYPLKMPSFYPDRSSQSQLIQTAWKFGQALAWLSICLLIDHGGQIAPAAAEGSKELVANGGNRPYTEWRINTTGGITRRTLLKVYANAGEVINLGSSAVNVGSGNIKLFSGASNVDTATPLLDCKVQQAGTGVLNTRAKELAGALPISGGYTPCVYSVPTTGVYQVTFYGPDGVSGNTDPTTSNTEYISNPDINTDQKSTVSMWDITVRSSVSSTTDLTGRVFTDYVALITGSNGRYVKSKFYILTNDGYQYLTDFGIGSGLDPNGFIFFANKTGLTYADGKTLYRSGQSINNELTSFVGGVLVPLPSTFSYPIFFNPPANTAIAGMGYPLTAQPPLPATNFSFTGAVSGTANQASQGVGGTFSFNAPQSGNYQIVIDTNGDGIYDPISDLTLGGLTVAGANSVIWDGNDNSGVAVPPRPNNLAYNARVMLRGGEYHFPLLDAENAPDGFKIEMLNPPGVFQAGQSATTIYFDERNYKIGTNNINLGCATTTICDARAGVNSATGAHKFTNSYGDQKAIDTWIYFPSATVSNAFKIVKTTISGKVWHDVDRSANNTFNNISAPGNEVGTNAGGLNAVLVGSSGVISTAPVAADGTYLFTNVPNNQSNLTIRLSVPGAANSAAGLPTNWENTSPLTTASFSIATSNLTGKDFGIRQILPNVLLVKRITALNGQSVTANGTALNVYQNQSNYPYDDNDNAPPTIIYPKPGTTKWPGTIGHASSSFLLGAIDGVTVKPNDELEYTIYFLSAGDADANNVSLCDLIPEYQTFVPNAYNGYGSGALVSRGIALSIGNTAQIGLTNSSDADQGRYYFPGTTLPAACKIAGSIPPNSNGAVVINLGNLPKPTSGVNGAAAPTGYGYIRFRTKIN
jgi:uncharacterized repeat protein (TIGR01451 family)